MSSAPGGAKLDQSLDDILKTRRDNRPRGGKRARRGKKDGAPAAPVGGVKKATKPAKAAKPVPTGPSSNGDHKIIVSNLPPDVDEAQIKEYFNKTIGNLKKVMLTYGPDGRSRGICTLTFTKSHAALEAAKSLDGVKIDQRPMRVEVLVSAKDAPAAPTPKSLAERMSQPKKEKPQPKPATNTKAGAGRGRGNKRGRGGRAGARLPKKTVEELDAEMADYFVPAPPANGEAMQTNGNPASGGDTGMVVDDEMI